VRRQKVAPLLTFASAISTVGPARLYFSKATTKRPSTRASATRCPCHCGPTARPNRADNAHEDQTLPAHPSVQLVIDPRRLGGRLALPEGSAEREGTERALEPNRRESYFAFFPPPKPGSMAHRLFADVIAAGDAAPNHDASGKAALPRSHARRRRDMNARLRCAFVSITDRAYSRPPESRFEPRGEKRAARQATRFSAQPWPPHLGPDARDSSRRAHAGGRGRAERSLAHGLEQPHAMSRRIRPNVTGS
jgi:hypothetical protein